MTILWESKSDIFNDNFPGSIRMTQLILKLNIKLIKLIQYTLEYDLRASMHELYIYQNLVLEVNFVTRNQ